MLLLDERQEVLMLVTNSLKNDLNSQDQSTIGLALTALGNICSSEMARDLSPEVNTLLSNSNPYLRKKAALCARRIIVKVPEMTETFADRAMDLLSERNHAVVLSGITLMVDIIKQEEVFKAVFRQTVPQLCRILRVLVSGGFAAEYDVQGVSDPYLQVKVLQLLRILGEEDEEASDAMGDVLAQVATNLDGSKMSSNAVLYECVRTIISIKSIGGLRVLAVNTLGRFLSFRDNNMRYIALSLLLQTVRTDPQAIQRHRNTILDCVKDDDMSIRKKALELVFALVNDGNSQELISELLDYLRICQKSFKEQLTEKICLLIHKYSSHPHSHIDSMARALVESGEYVKEDACRDLISRILSFPSCHMYACEKIVLPWIEMGSGETNSALLQVALWVVGEYGDMLMGAEFRTQHEQKATLSPITLTHEILKIIQAEDRPEICRLYALNALAKIGSRTDSESNRQHILQILDRHATCISLEEQNRSVEYLNLFNHRLACSKVLEHIPVPQAETDEEELLGVEEEVDHGAEVDLSALLGLDKDPRDLEDKTETGGPVEANSSAANSLDVGHQSAQELPDFGSFEGFNDDILRIDFKIVESREGKLVVMANYLNKLGTAVEDFKVQAAVPKHMKLKLELASSKTLPPANSISWKSVFQKIHISKICGDQSRPVVMKLRMSYKLENKEVTKIAEVGFPANL